jgi:hypothetical protein
MTKQVFIINGSGGCGKDTFISFVSDIACVTNFSSVDKVKEIARIIGWDGEKTERQSLPHDSPYILGIPVIYDTNIRPLALSYSAALAQAAVSFNASLI